MDGKKQIKMQQQIAYYRVSTQKQGQSGLGLEAQKNNVLNFLKQPPDFEFTEVESGKKSNRLRLADAIEKTKEVDGRLVIAKLDRLSRNVHFLSGLIESKVNFICCDNPNATPFILHILSAVAEHEAKMISQRTKDALKAKKDRGEILGAPKGVGYEERITAIRNGEISKEKYLEQRIKNYPKTKEKEFAIKKIEELLNLGFSSVKITNMLNNGGYKTILGFNKWNVMQVYRLIKEIKNVKSTSEIQQQS